MLRMLGLFQDYRRALLTVSFLIALYKCIELIIPLLAARVINAMEAHRPTSEIWVMAVTAFVVWVIHGNLLAYLFDRIEMQCFSFPARYHLSMYALDHVLGVRPSTMRKDPALQQVIIERGEQVIAYFVVSLIRVVIPLALPFLFVAVMLLWSIPLLGAMVLIGAATDGLITWRLNKTLFAVIPRAAGTAKPPGATALSHIRAPGRPAGKPGGSMGGRGALLGTLRRIHHRPYSHLDAVPRLQRAARARD